MNRCLTRLFIPLLLSFFIIPGCGMEVFSSKDLISTEQNQEAIDLDQVNWAANNPKQIQAWNQLQNLMRYCVPPSIMTHSADRKRINPLGALLRDYDYKTITYRDYALIIEGKKPRPRLPTIICHDDPTTDYVLPRHDELVDALIDNGMVASIALWPRAIHPGFIPPDESCASDNYHGEWIYDNYAYQWKSAYYDKWLQYRCRWLCDQDEYCADCLEDSWSIVEKWFESGMSIENHTSDHITLCAGEHCGLSHIAFRYQQGSQSANTTLECQVADASRRIKDVIGQNPVALVLPGGYPLYNDAMRSVLTQWVAQNTSLKFIVGIMDIHPSYINPNPDDLGQPVEFPLNLGRLDIRARHRNQNLEPNEISSLLGYKILHWHDDQPLCKNLESAMDRLLGGEIEENSYARNRVLFILELWNNRDSMTSYNLYSLDAVLVTPDELIQSSNIKHWLSCFLENFPEDAKVEITYLETSKWGARFGWKAQSQEDEELTLFGEEWIGFENGLIIYHYSTSSVCGSTERPE